MIKFCSQIARKIHDIGRSTEPTNPDHDSVAGEDALLAAVLGPQHWLTQPSLDEVEDAIAAGAVACKVDPASVAVAINQGRVSDDVRQLIDGNHSAHGAVDAYLQYVSELAEGFADLFVSVDGTEGWVAVEVANDPANDSATLITDARALRDVADNVLPMLSATAAGIEAIEFLLSENTPLMITDVASVAQAKSLVEACDRANAATGFSPAVFVDYAPLAFNEALTEIVRSYDDYIRPEALAIAGLAIIQHLHAQLESFEFHGSHVVNDAHPGHYGEDLFDSAFAMDLGALWAVEADESLPVRWQENPELLAELTSRIPEFSSAWKDQGLRPDQFANFAPVRRAQKLREQRWQKLLDTVRNQQSLGV